MPHQTDSEGSPHVGVFAITESRVLQCGKSHLVTAVAVKAGYEVDFASVDDIVRTLGHALVERTVTAKLKSYVAESVLVIDDVGLIPMDRAAATGHFQVVNRRYEIGIWTIVTTNRGQLSRATSSATPPQLATSIFAVDVIPAALAGATKALALLVRGDFSLAIRKLRMRGPIWYRLKSNIVRLGRVRGEDWSTKTFHLSHGD